MGIADCACADVIVRATSGVHVGRLAVVRYHAELRGWPPPSPAVLALGLETVLELYPPNVGVPMTGSTPDGEVLTDFNPEEWVLA